MKASAFTWQGMSYLADHMVGMDKVQRGQGCRLNRVVELPCYSLKFIPKVTSISLHEGHY
jgi:hypothetical protein